MRYHKQMFNWFKRSCCKTKADKIPVSPPDAANVSTATPTAENYSSTTPTEENTTDSIRRIKRVWIEEGCVVCGACELNAPKVFFVTEDTAIVRPEAEQFFISDEDRIEEAAYYCCVDVIKIEYEQPLSAKN
jgi:ferredoxin